MPKNRNAEMGDLLEAIERASNQELRELRGVRRDINALSGVSMTISRSNGAQNGGDKQSAKMLRQLVNETRKRVKSDAAVEKRLQMRSFSRNSAALRGGNAQAAAKAAERIVKAQTNTRQRDAHGRFVSPQKIGGNTIIVNARAPERPRGGSLYSQTPKSAQAAAKAAAADQREATEEQTKKLGESQDKTNSLLQELLKAFRKKERPAAGGTDDAGGLGGLLPGGRRGSRRGRGGRRARGRGRGKFGKVLSALGAGAAGAWIADTFFGSEDDTPEQRALKDAGGAAVGMAATSKTAQKLGGKAVSALAGKAGAKIVGKVGLRAIPVIGTALSAGIDAVQGWNDTEAQQGAFGLQAGQQVSTRQKAEYSLANVADMGGLVSGTSQLMSMGAGALGFEKTAQALNFNTADMARGIDDVGNSVVTGVQDAWTSVQGWFSDDAKTKEEKDDDRNQKLLDAIEKLAPGSIGVQNALNTGYTLLNDMAAVNGQPAPGSNINVAGTAQDAKGDNMAGKGQYEPIIQAAASKYGVAPEMIRAIIQTESGWNPTAASGTGPVGMMQLSEGAAKDLGYSLQDRLDPAKNIDMGTKYFRQQLDRYGGDTKAALLAYNQGAGNADKILAGKKAINTEGSKYINNANFAPFVGKNVATGAPTVSLANPVASVSTSMVSTITDALKDVDLKGLSSGFNTEMTKANGEIMKVLGAAGIKFGYQGLGKDTLPPGLGGKPAGITGYHDYGPLTPAQPNAAPVTATPVQNVSFMDNVGGILRGSAADTFDYATRGLSGSTMLDSVMGGMNPWLQGVLSPLTGAAGKQIDSWLGTGRNAVMDLINGTPTKAPQVTDLAMNGVTPTVSRDASTTKANDDVLSQLKAMVDKFDELIGVTKDNVTGNNPDVPQASAQPGPNNNIPLQGMGQAFEEMIRGLF